MTEMEPDAMGDNPMMPPSVDPPAVSPDGPRGMLSLRPVDASDVDLSAVKATRGGPVSRQSGGIGRWNPVQRRAAQEAAAQAEARLQALAARRARQQEFARDLRSQPAAQPVTGPAAPVVQSVEMVTRADPIRAELAPQQYEHDVAVVLPPPVSVTGDGQVSWWSRWRAARAAARRRQAEELARTRQQKQERAEAKRAEQAAAREARRAAAAQKTARERTAGAAPVATVRVEDLAPSAAAATEAVDPSLLGSGMVSEAGEVARTDDRPAAEKPERRTGRRRFKEPVEAPEEGALFVPQVSLVEEVEAPGGEAPAGRSRWRGGRAADPGQGSSATEPGASGGHAPVDGSDGSDRSDLFGSRRRRSERGARRRVGRPEPEAFPAPGGVPWRPAVSVVGPTAEQPSVSGADVAAPHGGAGSAAAGTTTAGTAGGDGESSRRASQGDQAPAVARSGLAGRRRRTSGPSDTPGDGPSDVPGDGGTAGARAAVPPPSRPSVVVHEFAPEQESRKGRRTSGPDSSPAPGAVAAPAAPADGSGGAGARPVAPEEELVAEPSFMARLQRLLLTDIGPGSKQEKPEKPEASVPVDPAPVSVVRSPGDATSSAPGSRRGAHEQAARRAAAKAAAREARRAARDAALAPPETPEAAADILSRRSGTWTSEQILNEPGAVTWAYREAVAKIKKSDNVYGDLLGLDDADLAEDENGRAKRSRREDASDRSRALNQAQVAREVLEAYLGVESPRVREPLPLPGQPVRPTPPVETFIPPGLYAPPQASPRPSVGPGETYAPIIDTPSKWKPRFPPPPRPTPPSTPPSSTPPGSPSE